MTTTHEQMIADSLAAKEAQLRASIAALPAEYLARIGLDTPEAVEAHIADEMADEAYRLSGKHRRYIRVLDGELAGWVGYADAPIADFERGIVDGRRVKAEEFCTPDCAGQH